MAITPQIESDIDLQEEIEETQLPSKTYKLNLNTSITRTNSQGMIITEQVDKIIGFIDNIEAIKQAIYHILSVERGTEIIYDEDYGVEFEQYIGQDFEYLETTIEDTLKEALTMDLRILDATVNNVEDTGNSSALINFTVNTIYGDLVLEVNINV